MRKEFLSYLLIFILGLVLGAGIFILSEQIYQRYSKQSVDKTTISQKSEEKTENKFILSKKVSAWLVWWDQDRGFESLKKNKDKISSLKPFWYKVVKNGEIEKLNGAEDQEIIEFVQKNNIKIIPAITNDNDPFYVEPIIKDENLTNEHINKIISLVEKQNYDGIEIDYESLNGQSDRAAYSAFITKLADQLHAKGKILTIAVHAKSSDAGTWEGPAAQDWKILGEKGDEVKIMTYDYHWETSEAGDIAPISWMREVLNYAVKTIDPQKISLGIHFYGYDWLDKKAEGLTYNDVLNLIERYNPEIKTSSEFEKYFSYTKNGEKHQVYFADNETVAKRIELVNQYNLAGIGIWRLGGEDPLNWQKIQEIFK